MIEPSPATGQSDARLGAPALTITLRLEEEPRVCVDALDEDEYLRLMDWIYARPELARIVEAMTLLTLGEDW